MHLVDEEHGDTIRNGPCILDRGADILDARENRGKTLPTSFGGVGEQFGQGRLAGSRRPPKDHRVDHASLGELAQRSAFAEKMFLADEFVEISGAHPVRKRT